MTSLLWLVVVPVGAMVLGLVAVAVIVRLGSERRRGR